MFPVNPGVSVERVGFSCVILSARWCIGFLQTCHIFAASAPDVGCGGVGNGVVVQGKKGGVHPAFAPFSHAKKKKSKHKLQTPSRKLGLGLWLASAPLSLLVKIRGKPFSHSYSKGPSPPSSLNPSSFFVRSSTTSIPNIATANFSSHHRFRAPFEQPEPAKQQKKKEFDARRNGGSLKRWEPGETPATTTSERTHQHINFRPPTSIVTMFTTKVLRQAGQAAERTPSIKFLGKRTIPCMLMRQPHFDDPRC